MREQKVEGQLFFKKQFNATPRHDSLKMLPIQFKCNIERFIIARIACRNVYLCYCLHSLQHFKSTIVWTVNICISKAWTSHVVVLHGFLLRVNLQIDRFDRSSELNFQIQIYWKPLLWINRWIENILLVSTHVEILVFVCYSALLISKHLINVTIFSEFPYWFDLISNRNLDKCNRIKLENDYGWCHVSCITLYTESEWIAIAFTFNFHQRCENFTANLSWHPSVDIWHIYHMLTIQ